MIIEIDASSSHIKKVIDIYTQAFIEQEREPTATVLKRLKQNRYQLYVYLLYGECVGFYIFDLHPIYEYAVLTFLAVEKKHRGKAIGTKLCQDAIERFNEEIEKKALFIEAKEQPSKLYRRLGFKKVPIEYKVPVYSSEKSEAMDLLCITKGERFLSKAFLDDMIRSSFIEGYLIDADDKRLKEQLKNIPKNGIVL